MDWAQILVIILASFLALFLLLAVVLVIIMIRVTRQIKSVTSSAERTVQLFEKTISQARGLASLPVIIKIVQKYMRKMKSKAGSHVDEK